LGQARPQSLDIGDDVPLTQYGEAPPLGEGFRDRLRPEIGETEMSLIFGDVDALAASLLVTKIVQPGAVRRVTTAGRLRACNFTVVHSPTKGNRLHVSVFPPEDVPGEPAVWDEAMAKAFNGCFTDEETGR